MQIIPAAMLVVRAVRPKRTAVEVYRPHRRAGPGLPTRRHRFEHNIAWRRTQADIIANQPPIHRPNSVVGIRCHTRTGTVGQRQRNQRRTARFTQVGNLRAGIGTYLKRIPTVSAGEHTAARPLRRHQRIGITTSNQGCVTARIGQRQAVIGTANRHCRYVDGRSIVAGNRRRAVVDTIGRRRPVTRRRRRQHRTSRDLHNIRAGQVLHHRRAGRRHKRIFTGAADHGRRAQIGRNQSVVVSGPDQRRSNNAIRHRPASISCRLRQIDVVTGILDDNAAVIAANARRRPGRGRRHHQLRAVAGNQHIPSLQVSDHRRGSSRQAERIRPAIAGHRIIARQCENIRPGRADNRVPTRAGVGHVPQARTGRARQVNRHLTRSDGKVDGPVIDDR